MKSVDQVGHDHYRMLSENDVRSQAATVVVNAGGALRRLSLEEPSLDTIYNRYFQMSAQNQAQVQSDAQTGARHAA